MPYIIRQKPHSNIIEIQNADTRKVKSTHLSMNDARKRLALLNNAERYRIEFKPEPIQQPSLHFRL